MYIINEDARGRKDEIKTILHNRHNIQIKYGNNNNSRITSKISISLLFMIIILFFITIKLKNTNIKLNIILSRKSIYNTFNEKIFLNKLKSVLDEDEILENEMMKKHTTFQLGGPGKFFVKPKTIN